MKRSTSATIAVIALLLGSGASGLLFAMPAHEEQGKLKREKAAVEGEHKSLEGQVGELEGKLKGMAMDTIAYFDLRKATNKPREMESKTVETLASLTEIFNDHKIRVTKLDPKGESTGMNKPVPSPTPAAGAAEGAAQQPQGGLTGGQPAAAGQNADPNAQPTEPPIQLKHKQFQFVVQGEYKDLVKALSEVQGLPRAISVNQYTMKLLANEKAAAPADAEAPPVSPTLLELSMQLSITFLMDGGPQLNAPQAALPVAAPAAIPAWLAWWLGQPAEAAEEAAAPEAAAKTRFRFEGVSAEGGGLVIKTGQGTPRYTVIGLGPKKLAVKLEETSMIEAERSFAIGQNGIRMVKALRDDKQPGVVTLVVETDGSSRLAAKLNGRNQLALSPQASVPASVVKAAAPAAKSAAPAPAAKAAAPAQPFTLESVTFEKGQLVLHTRRGQATGSAGRPRFAVVGGNRNRLVVELTNTQVAGRAAIFPIEKAGIIQVRAALYTSKPLVTRLVIDTDGTVRLQPFAAADGRIRVSSRPMPGATAAKPKPAVKPVAAKPAVPAAKPAEPAAAKLAAAPQATPTPVATPEPFSGPHLTRSLSSSYRFPIERDKVTGRANPFKVLPNRNAPPAENFDVPQLVLPPAPNAGAAPAALPALPGAPVAKAPMSAPAGQAAAASYVLKAVLIWGSEPPVAVIGVGAQTVQVGLNASLPGNARVKAIKPDYVILQANGRDLRVNLAK